MKIQRGLTCNIYRPVHGDCSNGGLSGQVDRVTLVGPGVPEIFASSDDAPAVELGRTGGAVNARPAGEGRTWWMFGGCFIYSSDGRFPSQHPIPLHDRCETSDLAEVLSR